MIGFGIDLAGYTTGKTSFAAARWQGESVEATLFSNSVFSANVRHQTAEPIAPALAEEVQTLRRCFAVGPVAIDVPIDLQELLTPQRASRIWELTLRPIDQVLGAMRPLADRIGSPVARFRAIMRAGAFDDLLGQSLFETYPAGTWLLNDVVSKGYKGKNGGTACADLCARLNITPALSNDDAIDAVIVAVTAAADADHLASEAEFAERLRGLGPDKRYELPRGYRLLKRFPSAIRVGMDDFQAWLSRLRASPCPVPL
jgi:hypothetical protein